MICFAAWVVTTLGGNYALIRTTTRESHTRVTLCDCVSQTGKV